MPPFQLLPTELFGLSRQRDVPVGRALALPKDKKEQMVEVTNEQMTNHKPLRTARTEPVKVLPSSDTYPSEKFTSHAEYGVPAPVVADQ